ncbi:MAG: mechanosensitive ion channel [Balneolia bacterium]|nr:mechanosensitive ion channel [Balneolia bacterium]
MNLLSLLQSENDTTSTTSEVIDVVENELADFFNEIWTFLSTGIFNVKGTEITLGSIIIFSFLIFFFIAASKILSRLLYSRVLKNVKMDESVRYTLQRITHYTILILGVLFSFQFIGIDLSGLTVIFGLLSVGIGFGLQNLTSNFISGIMLLFERPISVGDRIIVGELEGDVKEINMRSTTINSIDNVSIIVPNSDFISGNVINYSHGDTRIRITVDVGVSYSSDLDLVLKVIKEVAMNHERVIKSPEPIVLFRDFGDSAWEMRLRCWIFNPKEQYVIASELRCEIVREFRKNNIDIPFPQRDLHVRSPLPVPLTNREKTSE